MTRTPRHALTADITPGSAVLARSFHADPTMSWLWSDEATRLEDLEAMFAAIFTASRQRGHTFVLDRADTGCSGAAIWSPPEVEPFADEDVGVVAERLVERYGEEGLGRLGELMELMGAHHPTDPHFYLFIVGIDPSLQGQGLGARLLEPVLAACDAQGTPSYLESSNPRNISLYRRLGYEVTSEFRPSGGPLLTGMWRTPR